MNEILVLMKPIFIKDGSSEIAGNDASLYSSDDTNLFISLIFTDAWLPPVYCTFVCEINNNNNNIYTIGPQSHRQEQQKQRRNRIQPYDVSQFILWLS